MADLLSKIEEILKPEAKKGMAGLWYEEHEFVEAARKTREAGFTKFEALSPYPLHGIDEAMNIPRSYIPYIAFVFGILGAAFGTWLTWWTSASDWPLIVGGKPMWSLPAFIPVIFECTILFAALSSVISMIIINGLPKVNPTIIDPAITSHKFALFVPEDDTGYSEEKVQQLFNELNAKEVKKSEF